MNTQLESENHYAEIDNDIASSSQERLELAEYDDLINHFDLQFGDYAASKFDWMVENPSEADTIFNSVMSECFAEINKSAILDLNSKRKHTLVDYSEWFFLCMKKARQQYCENDSVKDLIVDSYMNGNLMRIPA